ncbi:MAG TPA: DedA family protein [Rhodospirillales bacterium]|jgi:membrane protein YqaA with SNARE-associated domain|nr:DedA family protein [Rhodospirillales bacterium]HIL76713.1 DedA family protein [Rhodospirillales bacterium]
MLRKLYDWILNLAGKKYALMALALISLIESSIFPIPPDILLIPIVLAMRDRAWLAASICTAASVIGGIFGYGIGFFMYEQIGKPVLEFYSYTKNFSEFQITYNQWGAWAVFFAGITPFPYKVITILSGATGLNLTIFIIGSILARGTRFFVIAALLWKYGDPARAFIERRLGLLFILFVVLLIGSFFLIKFLL